MKWLCAILPRSGKRASTLAFIQAWIIRRGYKVIWHPQRIPIVVLKEREKNLHTKGIVGIFTKYLMHPTLNNFFIFVVA